MTADFSNYLKVPMSEVPKTLPSLPNGHFFATIKSWKTAERYYDKENPKKSTPVVELTFTITAPDSDVDEDLLPNGKLPVNIGTRDYNLAEGGSTNIRNLAEDTLDLDVKGLDLEDTLNALKGQECKVYNEPRAGKEEGQFYTNIKKVLSAHG